MDRRPAVRRRQILLSIPITLAANAVIGAFRSLVLREQTLAREEAARRLAEAELKLLQARTEPPFLFNTLSTAIQLVEEDPRAPAACCSTRPAACAPTCATRWPGPGRSCSCWRRPTARRRWSSSRPTAPTPRSSTSSSPG